MTDPRPASRVERRAAKPNLLLRGLLVILFTMFTCIGVGMRSSGHSFSRPEYTADKLFPVEDLLSRPTYGPHDAQRLIRRVETKLHQQFTGRLPEIVDVIFQPGAFLVSRGTGSQNRLTARILTELGREEVDAEPASSGR